jgi:ATP-dependent DNA helicase RecQ
MTDELDAVLQTAHEVLGFDSLHDEQEAAIAASLGGRDVVALLPTGAGKSAIYQLAGDEIPGMTLVVSPLLALQRDQITAINDSGLDEAAALDGTMSRSARRRVVERAAAGELEYLFCTA